MKKHIPNLFTLGNLLCGTLAIYVFVSQDVNWLMGVYLIGIGAVLDFFDGFIARALKVSGELGKQLDSLADMVSFGVAPAFGLASSVHFGVMTEFSGYEYLSKYIEGFSLVIALFSALRLAKFNIDTRQSDRFIGLPTPANTILVLSIAYSMQTGDLNLVSMGVFGTLIYLLFVVISSLMMVSEIQLIALKFKTFGWRNNEARWILIAASIAIFALASISGLAIVVLLYLIISIIDNRIHRHEVSR